MYLIWSEGTTHWYRGLNQATPTTPKTPGGLLEARAGTCEIAAGESDGMKHVNSVNSVAFALEQQNGHDQTSRTLEACCRRCFGFLELVLSYTAVKHVF